MGVYSIPIQLITSLRDEDESPRGVYHRWGAAKLVGSRQWSVLEHEVGSVTVTAIL